MRLLGASKSLGDQIKRIVPGNRCELSAAFCAGAAERMHKPIGMMYALGVTRDLGADDAGGIGIVLGAANAADDVIGENLHLKRTCRRTIVRTDRGKEARADGLIHSVAA
jgi:hypothetical protein